MTQWVLLIVFLWGSPNGYKETKAATSTEVYFYDEALCKAQAELWRATPGVFVARCMQVSK